jgi:hypothetical protein
MTDVQALPDGWSMTLQQTGTLFKALFRSPAGSVVPPDWQPGSLVGVTGICSVISDDTTLVLSGIWRPQAFQLLLRSPADVALLKPPTWWTTAHLIFLLLAFTGASLLVAAVAMFLAQRRLNDQSAAPWLKQNLLLFSRNKTASRARSMIPGSRIGRHFGAIASGEKGGKWGPGSAHATSGFGPATGAR